MMEEALRPWVWFCMVTSASTVCLQYADLQGLHSASFPRWRNQESTNTCHQAWEAEGAVWDRHRDWTWAQICWSFQGLGAKGVGPSSARCVLLVYDITRLDCHLDLGRPLHTLPHACYLLAASHTRLDWHSWRSQKDIQPAPGLSSTPWRDLEWHNCCLSCKTIMALLQGIREYSKWHQASLSSKQFSNCQTFPHLPSLLPVSWYLDSIGLIGLQLSLHFTMDALWWVPPMLGSHPLTLEAKSGDLEDTCVAGKSSSGLAAINDRFNRQQAEINKLKAAQNTWMNSARSNAKLGDFALGTATRNARAIDALLPGKKLSGLPLLIKQLLHSWICQRIECKSRCETD